MYKKDFERLRAKIYHKMRWIYVRYFQTRHRILYLYKSYRKCDKRCVEDVSFERTKNYMTKIVNPSAGIGDQLASWITGYYYAHLFGLKYAYSPLFPSKWNSFLGFNINEQTVKELLAQGGYKRIWLPHFNEYDSDDIKLIKKIISTFNNKKVVYFLEINQVYTEQIGALPAIKNKYLNAPCRQTEVVVYNKNNINIALHIRRGDIAEGHQANDAALTFRWMNNDYYVKILDQVLQVCVGKKVDIYLFSQGNKEDFTEFYKYPGIKWCLDMSATDSFLHMVKADILITSKSSFSYNPALLSEGIKICPLDFWHAYPEGDRWILADENGGFDIDKLRQQWMCLDK